MKNTSFWSLMIVGLLIISGFMLTSGASSGSIFSGAVVSDVSLDSGNVQVVNFHVEGSSYVFEPTTVKKGIPVRLVGDISRMPGCSKSVISSELGIRKTFREGDNTFEFTPNKAGQFYVACSMNMYKGNLVVLESDGSKSNYVQKVSSSSGSCGMGSGGGCGCGG